MIDQTALPAETVLLDIHAVDDLIAAIGRLSVRGAPALGVAGAMGVVLAAQQYDGDAVAQAAARLRMARPTAVNLSVGVDRALTAWRSEHARRAATALAVVTRTAKRASRWPIVEPHSCRSLVPDRIGASLP